MKKNLLKTLLIIAALAMGTSAWGQVTTAFTQDFTAQGESTNPSDYGFTCVTESSGYSTTSVIEGVLKNVSGGYGNGSRGAEYVADFEKIGSGNVVKVTFKWSTGDATGNKTQSYSETYIADENGKRVFSIRYLGQNRYLNVNGVQVATNVARKSTFDVSAKVNLTTKMIDSLSVGNAYTATNIAFESAEAENISKFGFIHYARASTWTNTSSIDDVSITYEAVTETVANYIVKYVDESSNEIATQSVRTGVVGEAITLMETDKNAIFYNDVKYIYKSDDVSGKIVEENGSTVVTVTFCEAEKYSYTVNAVSVSTVLKELVSGTQYEGERARAFYSKAFNLDGKWYMTEGNSAYPTYAKDFTEAGVLNVEFAESDIAYFSEIEDLTPSAAWASGGTVPERYSNGKAVRLAKNSYVSTAPIESGGICSVTVWARNTSSSLTANIPTIGIKDSEGNITDLGVTFAQPWGTNTGISKTLDNVVIPAGYSLVLNNTSSWSSNLQLDYIYLKKTGELTQDVAVSAAGLATYCAPVAVDFSSASKVAAYKAVVNGTTVNLTKVTSAAAGEGVLLRSVGGGATSETLPVLATATKAADNAFVGTLSDINVLEDDGTNINYVLSKEGNEVGFYKAAVAGTRVGAGKAYLPVAKSNTAKSLTFVYSDDATGISEIATDVNRTADGAIYSLSGVRVQNPSKGLYIMNGKKVIVK